MSMACSGAKPDLGQVLNSSDLAEIQPDCPLRQRSAKLEEFNT
jgi:hypothetical protein